MSKREISGIVFYSVLMNIQLYPKNACKIFIEQDTQFDFYGININTNLFYELSKYEYLWQLIQNICWYTMKCIIVLGSPHSMKGGMNLGKLGTFITVASTLILNASAFTSDFLRLPRGLSRGLESTPIVHTDTFTPIRPRYRTKINDISSGLDRTSLPLKFLSVEKNIDKVLDLPNIIPSDVFTVSNVVGISSIVMSMSKDKRLDLKKAEKLANKLGISREGLAIDIIGHLPIDNGHHLSDILTRASAAHSTYDTIESIIKDKQFAQGAEFLLHHLPHNHIGNLLSHIPMHFGGKSRKIKRNKYSKTISKKRLRKSI